MMIKIISLVDEEEDCMLQVVLDSEHTGAMLYGKNQHNDRIVMVLDDKLLKQLCKDVSKAIKSRAQKTNECGYVKHNDLG